MNKKIIDDFSTCRNDVEKLIDELINETLAIFDSYEEAIQAIRQLKYNLTGPIGFLIIEESIKKIESIALKKATK
ncbi:MULTISPECIES: hypothetical protein [Enterococcus]|uniref:Uncharacterized protein n=1 Tax=Enterococcus raffinosus TaxID=71452 RepID=A0AAW8TBN5_9ENTE|nr:MULTISPECIES: hypothetical protein [Enterococcus]BBM19800.1 hypothetical protein G15_3481 [Enterococcus avium]MDT2532112.1 hypothetical protein [Enterococcus raffinosus]MDT2545796.1 hypothetical protein [Enterococcus raffinosus]MDT2579050.1 hypothetical protein [Enterococcus raffinosus]SES67894.1 hypothetical protein SAMN04487821_101279 [Enterococcus malodoratus]